MINYDMIMIFKVDRLQIIVVAKKYIYVSQLFISRMPKMHAIPQLVSAHIHIKIQQKSKQFGFQSKKSLCSLNCFDKLLQSRDDTSWVS